MLCLLCCVCSGLCVLCCVSFVVVLVSMCCRCWLLSIVHVFLLLVCVFCCLRIVYTCGVLLLMGLRLFGVGCLLFVVILLFDESCCCLCVLSVWRALFVARGPVPFALVSW